MVCISFEADTASSWPNSPVYFVPKFKIQKWVKNLKTAVLPLEFHSYKEEKLYPFSVGLPSHTVNKCK